MADESGGSCWVSRLAGRSRGRLDAGRKHELGAPVAGLDAVEVMTVEEQDRRLAEPAIPQLAGVTEVAEMLGVTRQRASALTTHPAAPAPVARLASGPVYVRDSWCRFAETWPRRGGRPRRAS